MKAINDAFKFVKARAGKHVHIPMQVDRDELIAHQMLDIN
jgi:hypothetical protein